MRGRRWSTAWREDVGPEVTQIISKAQAATVARTASYAASALSELDMDAGDPNPINPDGFAGVTGAGFPVEDRAYSAVLEAVDSFYAAQDSGASNEAALSTALANGEAYMAGVAAEILADTARAAEAVAFASRPWVDGFIRSAEPGACSRCIILAGAFYLFNQGFLRHPRCRCNHLPAPADKSQTRSLIDALSPQRYFESLTEAEQNKRFGAAGAEAIRSGADIGQVVNARRGMQRAQVLGRDALVTTEGTTRRGFAGKRLRANGQRIRLMPETIALLADGDRDKYIDLLRDNGFIL